jgi:hypothetical protein
VISEMRDWCERHDVKAIGDIVGSLEWQS